MKKVLTLVIVLMAIVLVLGVSWGKLFKRGYTQNEYGVELAKEKQEIEYVIPFNEITLCEDTKYLLDIDFDGKMEIITRSVKGDVLVCKQDENGNYTIDVSSETPYCWIRINPCCPSHNAYTTINYTQNTIYSEAHYGCSEFVQKKFQRIGDTWIELLPMRPQSVINKELFPQPNIYREWLEGDRYAWRWYAHRYWWAYLLCEIQ